MNKEVKSVPKNKKLQDWQIEVIYKVFKKQTKGLSFSEVETALERAMPFRLDQRTLLRRLVEMKDRGLIFANKVKPNYFLYKVFEK